MKEPSSILTKYLGYVVMLILLIIWVGYQIIAYFRKKANSNQGQPLLNDVEDSQVNKQNQQIIINPQQRYMKGTFDVIFSISEIINSAVFVIFFEYFTEYNTDSYIYIVCCVFYGLKLMLFALYLVNNILIHCHSMSDIFIVYFTKSLDMIGYHLSLIDGIWKLYYSFPISGKDVKPATFWNITFSLAYSVQNGVFLGIKYELKAIKSVQDNLYKMYDESCFSRCCMQFQRTLIEYFVKLLVLIPIFITINVITSGLAIIMAMTKVPYYTAMFGFFWIFGIWITIFFIRCHLTFFAALNLFIVVLNFVIVSWSSLFIATVLVYSYYDSTLDMNDTPYYGYTISTWILFVLLCPICWTLFPLIHAVVNYCCAQCGATPPGNIRNFIMFSLTYPFPIYLVIAGATAQWWWIVITVISALFVVYAIVGALYTIFATNIKQVMIMIGIVGVCIGGYYVANAYF